MVTLNALNCRWRHSQVWLSQDIADSLAHTRNVYGTNLISRDASGAKAFYLYNGHHDVVQLMTSTGSVVASYYYNAFGVILEESGSGSNPYRYSGYFYDSETTLYYLKARFYDAGLARFLQEDSYYGSAGDPLSLNLYTYVSNNPLVYWDPTGHYGLDVIGLILGASIAVIASTASKATSSGSSSRSSSNGTPVNVSMPDGSTVAGTLNNGVTTMPDGSRPPNGAVVHAPNGVDYQMNTSLGYGTPVTTVPVYTPSGTQTGVLSNGVTTMLDGSRPQDGWIVHAPNGVDYQMNAALGYGVPLLGSTGGLAHKSTTNIHPLGNGQKDKSIIFRLGIAPSNSAKIRRIGTAPKNVQIAEPATGQNAASSHPVGLNQTEQDVYYSLLNILVKNLIPAAVISYPLLRLRSVIDSLKANYDTIEKYCTLYGLSPEFLMAVIFRESAMHSVSDELALGLYVSIGKKASIGLAQITANIARNSWSNAYKMGVVSRDLVATIDEKWKESGGQFAASHPDFALLAGLTNNGFNIQTLALFFVWKADEFKGYQTNEERETLSTNVWGDYYSIINAYNNKPSLMEKGYPEKHYVEYLWEYIPDMVKLRKEWSK